jgi:hypothetical protein
MEQNSSAFYILLALLLDLNILLSTLFSVTLNLCSSLNGGDGVSHPYKTTDKIIVLCRQVTLVIHEGCILQIAVCTENVKHEMGAISFG